MQNDAETDMAVRVAHNRGSFLVCGSVFETDVHGAKRFPLPTGGHSDSVQFVLEQKKCG